MWEKKIKHHATAFIFILTQINMQNQDATVFKAVGVSSSYL